MASKYTQDVFAATLQKAIKASGMTQKDIAQTLEVSQQTISKWVQGQTRPHDEALVALERLLGFEAGELARHAGQVILIPGTVGSSVAVGEPDIVTQVRAARRRGDVVSDETWAEVAQIATAELRKRMGERKRD